MAVDIRAFIFDLDGVITDTAEYQYLSWQRLADEEGLPFTRQDNEALRSVTRRESLRRLLKGREIDEETAQAWMQRKNDYYLELLDNAPPDMLPGIRNLIDEARAAGMKVAVASASRNVHIVLKKLNALDLFDAIADGGTVVHNKPSPDLLLWTAGRLNVSPQNAVVFEDAEAGVQAALAGGFRVVGIGSASVDKAHLVLPNTDGIRLQSLLETLNGIK
jgi:beta-phosphoglucomutase